MSQIRITSMALPRNSLDIRDITLISNVHDEGLHIKAMEENNN